MYAVSLAPQTQERKNEAIVWKKVGRDHRRIVFPFRKQTGTMSQQRTLVTP